jgi:hypothetical protein
MGVLPVPDTASAYDGWPKVYDATANRTGPDYSMHRGTHDRVDRGVSLVESGRALR